MSELITDLDKHRHTCLGPRPLAGDLGSFLRNQALSLGLPLLGSLWPPGTSSPALAPSPHTLCPAEPLPSSTMLVPPGSRVLSRWATSLLLASASRPPIFLVLQTPGALSPMAASVTIPEPELPVSVDGLVPWLTAFSAPRELPRWPCLPPHSPIHPRSRPHVITSASCSAPGTPFSSSQARTPARSPAGCFPTQWCFCPTDSPRPLSLQLCPRPQSLLPLLTSCGPPTGRYTEANSKL